MPNSKNNLTTFESFSCSHNQLLKANMGYSFFLQYWQPSYLHEVTEKATYCLSISAQMEKMLILNPIHVYRFYIHN